MIFCFLYYIEVINDVGLNGYVCVILGGDLDVLMFSLFQDDLGINLEQFLGLVLVICLNVMIEVEEGCWGLEYVVEVKVGVDMGKDIEGYQFFLDCQVWIF